MVRKLDFAFWKIRTVAVCNGLAIDEIKLIVDPFFGVFHVKRHELKTRGLFF